MRERLAAYLREEIFSGKRKPGERIVESVVARQLGVGQPTIREALQVLEHEGLITRTSQKGCRVIDLSLQDIQWIFEVRVELEALAASSITRKAIPRVSEELERVLARMGIAAKRNDIRSYRNADLEFHRIIWRSSGNEILTKLLEIATTPLFAFSEIKFRLRSQIINTGDTDEHRRLLEIIRGGGSSKATREAFRKAMMMIRQTAIEDFLHRAHTGGGVPPPKAAEEVTV